MSLQEVLAGIRSAEKTAGRLPDSVRLLAVTKNHSIEDIEQHVLKYGSYPLGENRGQELRDKIQIKPQAEWHFIGPLQRNKIKYLKNVSLIHALEDLWQAQAIAEAAEQWGSAPDVLLQVHNGEPQKHGALPENIPVLLSDVQATGLNVRGLMVMAPDEDAHKARQVFRNTARLANQLELPELSMGMSNDYALAIAEGATLVRIGRRIFHEKQS